MGEDNFGKEKGRISWKNSPKWKGRTEEKSPQKKNLGRKKKTGPIRTRPDRPAIRKP